MSEVPEWNICSLHSTCLSSTCEIPHSSCDAHTFSQCILIHSPQQYVYETNENGDKVVLGKGTYGVVYAGRDVSNQVRIAIKEIPEKDSTYENQHFPYWETLSCTVSHKNVFP